MNPEQRTGATRHVLRKTSSFSSVVSEPDASVLCYIKEEVYPEKSKARQGEACGDCISACSWISVHPIPGQGLHVGQRLLDEEIPVVWHFYL